MTMMPIFNPVCLAMVLASQDVPEIRYVPGPKSAPKARAFMSATADERRSKRLPPLGGLELEREATRRLVFINSIGSRSSRDNDLLLAAMRMNKLQALLGSKQTEWPPLFPIPPVRPGTGPKLSDK
jgi:hypothetical protein